MPKEGRVAPKERTNATFKPATGGAQEEIELPLKLMVLGDFTQRADERKIEDRKPISIDKNNFDEVEQPWNEATARRQARRCLRCDYGKTGKVRGAAR